jgi:hypothetical protein
MLFLAVVMDFVLLADSPILMFVFFHSSVTCNILMCDIKLARGTPSRSPRVVDFIKTALPQLCDLKDVDLLQNNCVVTSDVVMSAEKMMVDDLECIDLSADIDMVSLNPTESFEEDDKRKSAIKLSKTGSYKTYSRVFVDGKKHDLPTI